MWNKAWHKEVGCCMSYQVFSKCWIINLQLFFVAVLKASDWFTEKVLHSGARWWLGSQVVSLLD